MTLAVLRFSSLLKGAKAEPLSSNEVTSKRRISPVENSTRSIPSSRIFIEETSISGTNSPA